MGFIAKQPPPHLEAFRELALGLVITDGRCNDDVLARLPVNGSGHRVVGGQLQAVNHSEELRGEARSKKRREGRCQEHSAFSQQNLVHSTRLCDANPCNVLTA